MKTVYVNDANQATIICPKCGFMKEIEMTNFKNTQKSLKGKCRCGEIFRFTIEFRKNYRKKVSLAGEYHNNGKGKKGEIIVEDLSMNGIRFVNLGSDQISIDDKLQVKFKLDNQMRSEINIPVKVIWVNDKMIGTKFSGSKSFKSELGFYLRT
jgi:PilZ domain